MMRKYGKKKKVELNSKNIKKGFEEKKVYYCRSCPFLGRVTSPGVPVLRRMCDFSNEEVNPFGTCQCVGCGTPKIIDSVTK